MRNLFIFEMATLDALFEGPKGEIDWHVVDEEFNDFAIQQLKSLDLLLFGRVTYQMMASYWPTPLAKLDDPIVAENMNKIQKIVFSRTLDSVEWENTKLIKENMEGEIVKIKQQSGKDIAIFGSAKMASSLINAGLVDEFRIMVNPVVLGRGRPLFDGIAGSIKLKLVYTRTFKSGNILLFYHPRR